jgi:hypothetical protein
VNKVIHAMMNPAETFKRFSNLNTTHKLTPDSVFLDIGSGFGYPNFVATATVGCEGLGIEIVNRRVLDCQRVLNVMVQDSEYRHVPW